MIENQAHSEEEAEAEEEASITSEDHLEREKHMSLIQIQITESFMPMTRPSFAQ